MSVSLKWFPPSWVQIKAKDTIIYIDPAYLRTNFADYPKRVEFSKWPDPIDGLPEELENADIILVTHHHKDHCKGVTVTRLKKPETLIVAPKHCVKELGEDIHVIEAGKQIYFGDIKINAVEAYNMRRSNTSKVNHKKGVGVGYLINIEGRILYHAGDTDVIPEMKELGRVDLALLPIGGRGFTMNMDEAIKAARDINAKIIIPMHRYQADPLEFKKKVEDKSNIKVAPLRTGEVYHLK